MSEVVVHSARVVSDGSDDADAWIRLRGSEVAAAGSGSSWEPADEVVDAAGRVLTPGLVDAHVHGGAGESFDAGPFAAARAEHRAHGVTRSVASLVAAPVDALARRIPELVGEGIVGIHLEGPFLAPERRGAHDGRMLVHPTPAAVERLIKAGEGRIVQVTIAPELPHALDAIRRFAAAGIRVAVGHTTADADTTRAAIDAGATLLTHAFNAMPGIHHRDPGPIPTAAADPRVTLELIADGVHVSGDVMRMLLLTAPGRVAIVTDAMSATGMPDGAYALGGLDVEVERGVARLAGGGAIAGSTLTLDDGVRRVAALGVPLADAVAAATSVPAAALGLAGLGSLRPGSTGGAVLWSEGLEAERVWA
ncbi:N-acetylglucosamine-6-phosphate deacetylase [Microbacterium indicum]|uniref:N-acetylglucosamine-6-phosphate deacetylase n=1 Tax=Microbacterium indicum TaxID=358100 RepID=UPI0004277FA3|nr:amidohydrolase family protein [Microbacterium indicum]